MNGHVNGGVQEHNNSQLKVVICGAGPAGLLLAHHLLAFGEDRFSIVIYDKAEDPRETLKLGLNSRRYSIGITRRGENAMNLVPGLLEKVKKGTISADSSAMLLPFMSKPLVVKPKKEKWVQRSFVVDRFSLCASLMQALDDMHGEKLAKGQLMVRFRCGCAGVDLKSQTATFQPQGKEGIAPVGALVESYDLLVGADGLHSAVRLAFQQQVRNFELEARRMPGTGQVTHFPCPEGFSIETFHMIPTIPRSGGMGALGLPSPDGSLNFIVNWAVGSDPKEWLACSSPSEARDFIHSRLPYLNIPEDAAWKLRSAPPLRSMQIKCWQYHDTKGSAVLIGDAAHCTTPNIGAGCNASLVDACVLARLLLGEVVSEDNRAPDEPLREEQKKLWASDPSPAQVREKLPQLLEHYSAMQVKEGHALVDLSDSCGPTPAWAKILHALLFLGRNFLAMLLPFLVLPPVMVYASNTTTPYSRIYSQFKAETDFFLLANRSFREQQDALEGKEVLKKTL